MKTRASDNHRRIYAVVACIPRGRVATYGQVATVAGLPRQARQVGYALRALPPDTDLPWHRVVNARGKISARGDALGHEDLQAAMLHREGVRPVDGVIPFEVFQWRPRIARGAAVGSARPHDRAGGRAPRVRGA